MSEENVAEIWKPVQGFVNYEISNYGRCRSLPRVTKRIRNMHGKQQVNHIPFPGKMLKPRYDQKGYVRYVLYREEGKKQFKAHRLVAAHFIGELVGKLQVNHIDGVKDNNFVDNLEICTNRENQIHAYKTGLSTVPDNRGAKNGMSKVTEQQVVEMRIRLSLGESAYDLATEFGISYSSVRSICNGTSWKWAGGPITNRNREQQRGREGAR